MVGQLIGRMGIRGAHEAMMIRQMVLGMVIALVSRTGLPVDQFFLADAVLDPIKMHVNFFGTLLFDGPVGEVLGGGIVNLHQGRRLRVTHFGESGANGHRFLSVEISGSDFGFGRRAHHIAHDSGPGEKWAIGGRG